MVGKAGNVASRVVKVCDKAAADWIDSDRENDGSGVAQQK
jgi:hypothetical protein